MNSSELLKSLNSQSHNKHKKKGQLNSIPDEHDQQLDQGN